MKFEIITIFPDIFESYFRESIVKRALERKKINVNIHNLRHFAVDRRKTVDDTPYGGGAGMVLKVEPIWRCVQSIFDNQIFSPDSNQAKIPEIFNKKNAKIKNRKSKTRIILFSAKGKKYTQKDAGRLADFDNIIMICGRYEGVDERVAGHIADEEISIGDYILTGGELPAMVLVDSITRLLPGVLGNPDSLREESFSTVKSPGLKTENSFLEYPHYTKPENFRGWKVPQILLSGDHQKIKEWRENPFKAKNE